jgi:hypothetical protein
LGDGTNFHPVFHFRLDDLWFGVDPFSERTWNPLFLDAFITRLSLLYIVFKLSRLTGVQGDDGARERQVTGGI